MPAPAADLVFRAVADPTRRAILDLLAEEERSVGDVVARFRLSQPAISQHLRALADAGLVQRRSEGRLRIYRLRPRRLRQVHDWSARYAKFWQARLTALGRVLDERGG